MLIFSWIHRLFRFPSGPSGMVLLVRLLLFEDQESERQKGKQNDVTDADPSRNAVSDASTHVDPQGISKTRVNH